MHPRVAAFGAALLLGIAASVAVHSCAFGQAAQWNYSFDAGNNAIASYPSKAGAVEWFTYTGSGLTATGSNQATAYNLTAVPNGNVDFTTVPAGTGVALDFYAPVGASQMVWDDGGNSLTVYGAIGSSDTINGLADAVLPAGQGILLLKVATGAWRILANSAIAGGANIPATTAILAGTGVAGFATGITVGGGLIYTPDVSLNLATIFSSLGPACATSGILAQSCTLSGLSSTGTTLSVNYGTGTQTALQGSTLGAASGVAALDGSSFLSFSEVPPIVSAVGIEFSFVGTPAASALRQFVLPFPCNIPLNMDTSPYLIAQGWANTAPSGTDAYVVGVVHSGTPSTTGNLTFSSGSHTPSLPVSSAAETLLAGDVITVTGPAAPTSADVVLSVPCLRNP